MTPSNCDELVRAWCVSPPLKKTTDRYHVVDLGPELLEVSAAVYDALASGSVGGDQETAMPNAMLRTVAGQTNTVLDPTYQIPSTAIAGSLDVELEIDEAGQLALEELVPGAPVDVRARVVGGSHLTPGTTENLTTQRRYPELECNGTGYGPAQIIQPAIGGMYPILKLGETIVVRVG